MKMLKESTIPKIKLSIVIFFIMYYFLKFFMNRFDSLNPLIVEAIFEAICELTAIYIILRGIISSRIIMKRIWWFFITGIALNFIGDALWNINEIIFHRNMNDVSYIDIFYILGSIMFLMAIFSYLGKREIYSIIKTGFDISIIMTASMTLLYKYILMPIWINESLNMIERIVLILYPVFDLGYLTGILVYILNKKIISPKFNISLYLSIGFSFFLFADIMYTIDTAEMLVFAYEPFWMIGYASIAIASLYSNKTMINTRKQRMPTGKYKQLSEYFMFLLPYIIACIFIMIFNIKYIKKDALAVGATVTIILIMLRQIFVLSENLNLLKQVENTNIQIENYAIDLDNKNKKLFKLKNEKEKEANTDYLTQLYNRRYLSEWLNEEMKNMDDNDLLESSTILIDVDHYKEINDKYGHNTGDFVLVEISDAIKKSIRESDIAGRHGGDEFIIILKDTDLEIAKKIAERLRKNVHQIHHEEYPEMHITLSIGIVHWKGIKKDHSEDYMINAADKALYEAKKHGRNRIISRNI